MRWQHPTTIIFDALEFHSLLNLTSSYFPPSPLYLIDGFKQQASIPKKNVLLVEFHIRQAEKKLQLLKETNVTQYRG